MSDEKKRLRLLNEVLPAPEKPSSHGPRQRTMLRLQRLLSLGAAGAILTSSCDSDQTGYGVVDPMPSPACRGPVVHVTFSEPTLQMAADGTFSLRFSILTEIGADLATPMVSPSEGVTTIASESKQSVAVTIAHVQPSEQITVSGTATCEGLTSGYTAKTTLPDTLIDGQMLSFTFN